MTIKDSPHYKQLKEALEALTELNIPENLQKTALEHLLWQKPSGVGSPSAVPPKTGSLPVHHTSSLKAFVAELKPKGAVAEIPCLVYWAKMEDGADSLDEAGVIELYRRAGLKPPKNVTQSLRDLCSRKYGRLESVPDKKGHVRISRVGEDFVRHDVKAA
jgi:hypothetical protein